MDAANYNPLIAQEAAGIATWEWDLTTDVLSASSQLLVLYGRQGERLSSLHVWSEWIHPDDQQTVMNYIDAVAHRGLVANQYFQCEYRVARPDGDVRWLKSSGKVIEPANRGRCLTGATQDVTESRSCLDRLRQANEDLESFAYIASHDLQEPLRTVAGFTDLFARKNQITDAESTQYIHFIRQGVSRMQTLVSDLLTFSRMSRADTEALEMVDCKEVLDSSLLVLQKVIAESAAKIQVGPMPMVTANFNQLSQLFEGVIGNAVKFRRDEPPVIKISASPIDHGWYFSVLDNGIGFDMLYAADIFHAFKRLNSRDKYPGTGIGLTISKRIVERHGGRIWAESELGVGSRFCFTIKDLAEHPLTLSI